MTTHTMTCPNCGKAVSGELLGLCPECLLKAGVGTMGGGEASEQGGGAHAARFVPPTPQELSARFPQLEVTELLGHGGMGAVYKARQIQLDRVVALKILPPDVGGDPAFAERFTREAKALAQLSHPNIVTLYEFGQADGLFYFLMEFVDGVNLRRLLDSGKLAPREALAIVPQICEALQFAHDRRIVHRDIKPENILLRTDGVVKIADFGVAKIVGRERSGPGGAGSPPGEQTQARGVVGTPAYMAPEQVAHPADVDHRADIYALGVVFYQMLTGELPAKPIERPSRKVRIDVRLDEVVLRAMETEPQRRYSQASVMKTEVETIAGAPQPPLAPVLSYESLLPRRFSRPAIIGAAWSPFFFAAALFVAMARGRFPQDYSFPAQLLLFLGFASCFGTTILGWIAVSQIRHSGGRLYGLGLAVFDALLFPLLALDLGIYLGVGYAFVWTAGDWANAHPEWIRLIVLSLGLLIFMASAMVDFLAVRRVWRAVTTPLVTADIGSAPPASRIAAVRGADPTSQLPRPAWHRWVAVVGLRKGRRVINWPAAAFDAAVMTLLYVGGGLIKSYSQYESIAWKPALLAGCIMVTGTITASIYWGLKKLPMERLIPLDSSDPRKPGQAAAGRAPLIAAVAISMLLGILAMTALSDYWRSKDNSTTPIAARPHKASFSAARAIEQRLRDLGLDWDSYTIDYVPNTALTTWHFANLRERKGIDGRNVWTPIQGSLIVESVPNGGSRVSGDGQLGHVNFTVAPGTSAAPGALQPITPGFLPQRELEIVFNADLRDCFLDLDTGRVLSPPKELVALGQLNDGYPQSSELREWMRSSGADLVKAKHWSGLLHMDGAHTLEAETTGPSAKPRAFDTLPVEQILKSIDHAAAGTGAVTLLPPIFNVNPGAVSVVRTREGAVALIEIIEDDARSGRVRLRYKQVRSPTTAPATAPALRPIPPEAVGLLDQYHELTQAAVKGGGDQQESMARVKKAQDKSKELFDSLSGTVAEPLLLRQKERLRELRQAITAQDQERQAALRPELDARAEELASLIRAATRPAASTAPVPEPKESSTRPAP